jgi:nucleotide-binding universal stress UspA family protein
MLKEFRNIVCPIDFDEPSLAAVRVGKQISQENDGKLYVMHAVHPSTTVLAVGGAAQSAHDVRMAEQQLDRISREHLGDVDHQVLVRVGDAAEELIKAERELSADLVVMAWHADTAVFHLLRRGVMERLAHESYCPVLIVPSKAAH